MFKGHGNVKSMCLHQPDYQRTSVYDQLMIRSKMLCEFTATTAQQTSNKDMHVSLKSWRIQLIGWQLQNSRSVCQTHQTFSQRCVDVMS